MKKKYMTPATEVVEMEMANMIANSPYSISDTEASEGTSNEPVNFSNERRGIFSNDNEPGYNRSLWWCLVLTTWLILYNLRTLKPVVRHRAA